MKTSSRARFLWTLAENLPTVAFLAILQTSGDLRLAGWAGAVFAAAAAAAYISRRRAPHPILLGVNIYMLAITPATELLFLLGDTGLGRTVLDHAQAGVFIAVFLCGCVQTALSPGGFIGAGGCSRRAIRAYSLTLLVISLGAAVWAFAVQGSRLVEMGVPFLTLFGVRQWLAARIAARRACGTGSAIAPAAARGAGPLEDDISA